MSDNHRPSPANPMGEQEGEETELTGQPMDPESTPHTRTDSHDEDSDAKDAKKEQDRQLETGEESPS